MLTSLILALEVLALPAPLFAQGRKPGPRLTGIPVARVSIAGGRVERSEAGRDWQGTDEGFPIKTGDRLRTGSGTVARIEFPWMAVTVAPLSTLWIPGGLVLSTVLEEGRAEMAAGAGEIIKLRTTDAQVRGRGRVVVRRAEGKTFVSVMDGSFRVEAAGRSISLDRGEGAVVQAERAPVAVPLPDSPTRVSPGADPLYVPKGGPVALAWEPSPGEHHVQILGVDSDAILIERDVNGGPHAVDIPWLGTFRWRVTARGEYGLESLPSPEGYVCVVEK